MVLYQVAHHARLLLVVHVHHHLNVCVGWGGTRCVNVRFVCLFVCCRWLFDCLVVWLFGCLVVWLFG